MILLYQFLGHIRAGTGVVGDEPFTSIVFEFPIRTVGKIGHNQIFIQNVKPAKGSYKRTKGVMQSKFHRIIVYCGNVFDDTAVDISKTFPNG
ncbi:hypothetical protein SDC9_99859 [bioreactor metagenome]|uniref:Uncharacterized protein n=1 Tax=bioreactor metagenome TaxID=1076179 RepID=A0A645AIQ1_9ZZZZ